MGSVRPERTQPKRGYGKLCNKKVSLQLEVLVYRAIVIYRGRSGSVMAGHFGVAVPTLASNSPSASPTATRDEYNPQDVRRYGRLNPSSPCPATTTAFTSARRTRPTTSFESNPPYLTQPRTHLWMSLLLASCWTG